MSPGTVVRHLSAKNVIQLQKKYCTTKFNESEDHFSAFMAQT